MPVRFHDEWQALLALEPWCPLDAVAFETRHLGEFLYQLSETAYLYAVSIGADLKPTTVPRVTVVMWAADIGIARRVALREIEADQGGAPAAPPRVLLPRGATFRDVKGLLVNYPEVRSSMTASYRVATDGKHILSSVTQGFTQFVFRSVNPAETERCVAIKVQLPRPRSNIRT